MRFQKYRMLWKCLVFVESVKQPSAQSPRWLASGRVCTGNGNQILAVAHMHISLLGNLDFWRILMFLQCVTFPLHYSSSLFDGVLVQCPVSGATWFQKHCYPNVLLVDRQDVFRASHAYDLKAAVPFERVMIDQLYGFLHSKVEFTIIELIITLDTTTWNMSLRFMNHIWCLAPPGYISSSSFWTLNMCVVVVLCFCFVGNEFFCICVLERLFGKNWCFAKQYLKYCKTTVATVGE